MNSELRTYIDKNRKKDFKNAAEILGVREDQIDLEFGIVLIDEIEHLYCVLLHLDKDQAHEGYANVRIQPFDLEEE